MEGIQYILFYLDKTLFGISIGDVQEIRNITQCTQIPSTPKEIEGILNLRGHIVTAIDLRFFYHLNLPENNELERDIIVNYQNEHFALRVDRVGDIININENEIISNHPTLETRWKNTSRGIYSFNQDVIVILDIDKLLNKDNFNMEISV